MPTVRSWTAAMAGSLVLAAHSAVAADHLLTDKQSFERCASQACSILNRKATETGNLNCELVKTWHSPSFSETATRFLTADINSLHCSLRLEVNQAQMVAAIGNHEHVLALSSHAVDCVLEGPKDVRSITATLEPKIRFGNGRADRMWINLTTIDGPATLTGPIKTATRLGDIAGLFHRPIITAINEFIHERCPYIAETAKHSKESRDPSKRAY
jgi:hypothetical protein